MTPPAGTGPPGGTAPPGTAPTTPPPVMAPAPPVGDPQAARRLAAAYRDAAQKLAGTERMATWTLGRLDGLWSGSARTAAEVPLDALAQQARTLAAGLTEAAEALETYARRLDGAQHDHAISVGKLVGLGVVVAITAGAVVVTAGAAAAVAAAGAESAVAAGIAGVTEAAGAAAAAQAGAAGGLTSCAGLLTGVRVFTAWALPHLAEAEVSAGTTAALDLATTGHISARGTAEAAALGFAGSVGSSKALSALTRSPDWAEASAIRRAVATESVQTAANAGTSAAQQLIDTGRVDSKTTLRDTTVSSTVHAARHGAPAATARAADVGRNALRRPDAGTAQKRPPAAPR